MQICCIALYHRDGNRRHELKFQPGKFNVVTGVSDTGKSAVLEIVDYCLGSGTHGVYRGPQLETIGWYGLQLIIGGERIFVARRRPPIGQKTSDHAMLIRGGVLPAPSKMYQTTNIATVVSELEKLIGIDENLQEPPEGSTRDPVTAGLRHAVPYVLQPQRLIADPKYLFDGQEDNFKEQHIRDTLPFFLGAVDQDSLAQRRDLRTRRLELRKAQAALADSEHADSAVIARASLLLDEAAKTGLINSDTDTAVADVRAILREAIDSEPPEEGSTLTGDAEKIAALQDRKNELGDTIREVRAEKRILMHRAQLAADVATEFEERASRLTSLDLLPNDDAVDEACPLCGSDSSPRSPAAHQLRKELDVVRAQTASAVYSEPGLEEVIDVYEQRIQAFVDQLETVDSELQVLVARDKAAAHARTRLEQQAYLRGRIEGFLQEHPPIDASEGDGLRRQVKLAEKRVDTLEKLLSADATRERTENALSYVGADMTKMAQRLALSYAAEGVRLDPVALTVVGRDPSGPIWLNQDIGSGKNWVGYHVITLLALHRYFIDNKRPVPAMLLLDQPTQAFFPSTKRDDPNRALGDMRDEDQEQVRRIFDLLRETVSSLHGGLQVIVMDHAEFEDEWFEDAVGQNNWRGGRGLVPNDWYA